MPPAHHHHQDIAALQDRLTRLCQASLNINESLDLDLDDVFRQVLDSARSLTRVSVPSSSRVRCQAFCRVSSTGG